MAGTTQISLRGFLGYQSETSFAASSTAYDTVLRVRDATLNVTGLTQEIVPRGGVYDRADQMDIGVPGPQTGATFSFTMDLYGHGSSTAGALTQTPLGRLLGHSTGVCTSSQVGGALTAGTNDVNTLTSTNTTLAIGDLFRVGATADGRAEGQATVSASASSPYSLLVSLPGNPTTADSVHAMQVVHADDSTTNAHLTSSGATSNNTLRFIVASAARQFALLGCGCTNLAFSIGQGEVPSVTFTFGVAYWEDIDVTFPTATASADFAPAPISGGSFFYNAVGTDTRQTDVPRNISFNVAQTLIPLTGPGGAANNQVITGWVRGGSRPTLSFDVESVDATTTPDWSNWFNTDPNTVTPRHILYTMTRASGRGLALYLPSVIPTGTRPTQSDLDGLQYQSITVLGREGPTTTTNLSRSAWRLGMG